MDGAQWNGTEGKRFSKVGLSLTSQSIVKTCRSWSGMQNRQQDATLCKNIIKCLPITEVLKEQYSNNRHYLTSFNYALMHLFFPKTYMNEDKSVQVEV